MSTPYRENAALAMGANVEVVEVDLEEVTIKIRTVGTESNAVVYTVPIVGKLPCPDDDGIHRWGPAYASPIYSRHPTERVVRATRLFEELVFDGAKRGYISWTDSTGLMTVVPWHRVFEITSTTKENKVLMKCLKEG